MTGWSWALAAALGVVEIADGAYPVRPLGLQMAAEDDMFRPAASADGRYVVFHSRSPSLVPGDGNGVEDVFVLDRATRRYQRLSVGIGGIEANGPSILAVISIDGRWVAFHSDADNLVGSDSNGRADVFVRDRLSGAIERVSVSSAGEQGNGNSFNASLSGDGRFVAFASVADNLVGGDTNQAIDIFVRDRQSAQTVRVSAASDGTEGDALSLLPTISANGRYVAFHSEATNFSDNEFDVLADIFLNDRVTGETSLINVSSDGVRANADSARAVVSPDGRLIAFYSRAPTLEPGRENVHYDIFVRDALSRRTELVSPGMADEPSNGSSFNPALSPDGRYVAFESGADNLAPADGNGFFDVYRFDRVDKSMELISSEAAGGAADGGSFSAVMSAAGEVLFESQAGSLDGLGADQLALFARLPPGSAAPRLSLAPDSTVVPDAPVDALTVSADGRYLLFETAASNLVAGDSNGRRDVFLFDRTNATTVLISGDPAAAPLAGADAGDSAIGGLSADGCVAVFASAADGDALGNAALIDDNGASDVYSRDRCGGGFEVLSLSLDGVRHANGPSAQAGVAADGARAVFASLATDLTAAGNAAGAWQVYLAEAGGAPILVSSVGGTPGTAASDDPVISADGNFVAFVGRDPALDPLLPVAERPAPGDAAIYRYRVADGTVELISRGLTPGGAPAMPLGQSDEPAISADGAVIAFASTATNLTTAGASGVSQVYVWREQGAEPNRIIGLEPPGGPANGLSERPALSPDGRFVLFQSDASNWAGDDANGQTDAFAYDLADDDVTLISRADDGAPAVGGASIRPAAGQTGDELVASFISSAALVGGVAVGGGLYLQPLKVPTARLVIDGFVDSPLQSVESGALRLQVRNTGNVALSAADGITLEFPELEHALLIGTPPRWLCSQSPQVSCAFVGDALVGDVIGPYAAERLDFEFTMFSGTDPVVSRARASADSLAAGLEPELSLITERVVRGLVWSAAASTELPPGELGEIAIEVINGGLEPVNNIKLHVSALTAGEPAHPAPESSGTDWQCAAEPPPEPDDPDPTPILWSCGYTGPPLAPGTATELILPFGLPRGSGRLASVVELAAKVDAISPRSFEILISTAEGLVFLNGFEG